MLDTLKSIILDFQEAPLETGVLRRMLLEPVRGKAAVCIGVRRSGKSTYMYQCIQRLIDSGVPRQNYHVVTNTFRKRRQLAVSMA